MEVFMEVWLRTPFLRGMKLQHPVICPQPFERPFCLYVKGSRGSVYVCRHLRHKGRLRGAARSDGLRRTYFSRPESGFAKSAEI